jgi:hypothetical protein
MLLSLCVRVCVHVCVHVCASRVPHCCSFVIPLSKLPLVLHPLLPPASQEALSLNPATDFLLTRIKLHLANGNAIHTAIFIVTLDFLLA